MILRAHLIAFLIMPSILFTGTCAESKVCSGLNGYKAFGFLIECGLRRRRTSATKWTEPAIYLHLVAIRKAVWDSYFKTSGTLECVSTNKYFAVREKLVIPS
jgi:hypothetical protein